MRLKYGQCYIKFNRSMSGVGIPQILERSKRLLNIRDGKKIGNTIYDIRFSIK